MATKFDLYFVKKQKTSVPLSIIRDRLDLTIEDSEMSTYLTSIGLKDIKIFDQNGQKKLIGYGEKEDEYDARSQQSTLTQVMTREDVEHTLREHLSSYKPVNHVQDGNVSLSKKEFKELMSRLDTHDESLCELKTRIPDHNLESENRELKRRLETLERKYQTLNEANKIHTSERERIEDEHKTEITSLRDKYNSSYLTLRKKVEKLQTSCSNQKTKIAELEAELKEYQQQDYVEEQSQYQPQSQSRQSESSFFGW